ncbi:hypothetical protein C8J57DRAFT_1085822 [Mycena rebaudengoi]|nr:hypothetical protein C8J57DRAFT_1085822 [Mycena rebaudengoi]
MRKANLLYWASSLMVSTYSFLDHRMSQAPEKPLFDIPQLHFCGSRCCNFT